MRELEIYVEAGFSPAEALGAATIVPARPVGEELKTGLVKLGKVADLALIAIVIHQHEPLVGGRKVDPQLRLGEVQRNVHGLRADGAQRGNAKALAGHGIDTRGRKRRPMPNPDCRFDGASRSGRNPRSRRCSSRIR